MMTAVPLPIRTVRLTVNPLRPSDGLDIERIYADERIVHYLGKSPYRDLAGDDTWERIFNRVASIDCAPLAIRLNANEKIIGICTILPYFGKSASPGDYEITIGILQEYCQKGLGRECFQAIVETLKDLPACQRIIVRIARCNTQMCTLAEKVHMRHEGIVRNGYSAVPDLLYVMDVAATE